MDRTGCGDGKDTARTIDGAGRLGMIHNASKEGGPGNYVELSGPESEAGLTRIDQGLDSRVSLRLSACSTEPHLTKYGRLKKQVAKPRTRDTEKT